MRNRLRCSPFYAGGLGVLDVVFGVCGGGFDVVHGFLGGFLEVLGHGFGGVGDLGCQGLGGGFELVRGFAFLLAGGDQGGDEHAGAERDEPGGQGVPGGFGFDLVRGVGDGLAGVGEFRGDRVSCLVEVVPGGV